MFRSVRDRLRHPEPPAPAGYAVRTHAGAARAGDVHHADARGVAVCHLPGHPGRLRWVPWGAVAGVDDAGREVRLVPGVEVRDVLRSPAPLHRGPDDAAWWAHLCAHYGLGFAPGTGPAGTLPVDAGTATPGAVR